jgi:hypothetical protein
MQQWSPTFVTAMQNGWAAFATHIISGLAWAVNPGTANVSYYSGHTWSPPDSLGNYHRIPTKRSPNALVEPITGTQFLTLLGSQRHRLRPG